MLRLGTRSLVLPRLTSSLLLLPLPPRLLPLVPLFAPGAPPQVNQTAEVVGKGAAALVTLDEAVGKVKQTRAWFHKGAATAEVAAASAISDALGKTAQASSTRALGRACASKAGNNWPMSAVCLPPHTHTGGRVSEPDDRDATWGSGQAGLRSGRCARGINRVANRRAEGGGGRRAAPEGPRPAPGHGPCTECDQGSLGRWGGSACVDPEEHHGCSRRCAGRPKGAGGRDRGESRAAAAAVSGGIRAQHAIDDHPATCLCIRPRASRR